MPVSTRSNVFQNRGPDEPGTLAPQVELKPLIFSSSHFPTLTNIKVLVRSVAAGVTRGSSSLTTLTACLERDPADSPAVPYPKNYSFVLQEGHEGEISGSGFNECKHTLHSNLMLFISKTRL